MTGRCHVRIAGARWVACLLRNHGGMPSDPCDLEVLIFDSWSSTYLNEMVSLAIFPRAWALVQIG